MSSGNNCKIIRYMGNGVLYEKLKISNFNGWEISMLYRYRCEENIDMILIFANITVPSRKPGMLHLSSASTSPWVLFIALVLGPLATIKRSPGGAK